MTLFVLLAAVLMAAGVALVAVPLLKRNPVEHSPAPWAAMSATGILAIGSMLLYLHWTNWSWQARSDADSPQTMVASLARKLERNPDDLNGWLMLGRSYTVLQQYPLALRAFRRADRLSNGQSADALLGEGEALVQSDENELTGNGGRLFERALALDPNNGKALFFGAAAALRRGQLPLARERFAKLLTLDPPDNIKSMLQQQIASIDQQISGAGPVSAGEAGAAPQVAAGGAAGEGGAAAGAAAKVQINVSLAPGMAQSAAGSSPLFVFVRDPERPGPPLAVKRLESHFPQTVELTALDSMVPGRAIRAGQKVQVVARIARSGNPVGASGDPFGESAYMVGRDGLVNIVIDRVMP